MTNADDSIEKKMPGPLAIVLGLLAFSVFINYIDRGNLSIAAPMLKDELGLSGAQLGMLLSSFFWTYGLFQIVSGWMVDRFNVNWIMAGGFFLWSAATSATGLLHGFTALLVVRTVLGMGESVAYPAYSRILSRYFPYSQRSLANAVIASGLACGPAFGMLLGGTLMSRFGWRPFFIVLGLVSMLWLAPWSRWMPRGPGITPKHTRWTGLQCSFGNLSGAATAAVTGLVLDRTGHFVWAFVVAAVFCVIGVLSWVFVVGPIEPVDWRKKRTPQSLSAEPELA